MTARRPIEIVGGGLAGLSLGIALRRAGIDVSLHEAADYPRHRVCGEFVAGLDDATLHLLGVESAFAGALAHREVAWRAGRGAIRIQRLPSPARGLSRHALDARLADLFVASGGVLATRSRLPDTGDVPGRVVATGRRRAAAPRWIGLKVHARGLSLARELEMHLGAETYVGLAGIEDGSVNVCGLFHRRPLSAPGPALLLDYLRAAGLDELADRLTAAELDPDSFCAVAALDFGRRHEERAGFSLGDASAAIPPFTGNGMAMAFQSAEIALPPLLAYARGECEWETACRVARSSLRRRFRVRLASASLLHSFLLQPRRQRWFFALSRARLLPFAPLYAALH